MKIFWTIVAALIFMGGIYSVYEAFAVNWQVGLLSPVIFTTSVLVFILRNK